ncbi:hypothetical protein [Micromonospora sp. NPDC048830]|uniref:hypothetical protein n=1 Tax=Micromonospora sp. NPDC048830 TaxID=3364257 RepID=UPI0037237F30
MAGAILHWAGRCGWRPDLLTQEFYEAWEVAAADADPWPRLLAPPPLHRRHAVWAVLAVHRVPGEAYPVTAGRVRGRLRALLSVLESAGSPDVHAWPWPFETADGVTRHAVGLGRAPPDRDRLTRLTADWCADLPGVDVGWAAGGAVPTLTYLWQVLQAYERTRSREPSDHGAAAHTGCGTLTGRLFSVIKHEKTQLG